MSFYDPEPHVRAAHALALATRRSQHNSETARLIETGRQILAQAHPIALEGPGPVMDEARSNVDAMWWEMAGEEGEAVDPREAIDSVEVSEAALQ